MGEDIRSILSDYDMILVDSPGFSGDVEAGYKNALSILAPSVDPDREGINIDGVCLFDPFFSGNMREIMRLLGNASVPVGTVFCSDRLEKVRHATAFTVGTNGDFSSGVGEWLGGTLGFEEISKHSRALPRCAPMQIAARLRRKLNGKMKESSGHVTNFSADLIPRMQSYSVVFRMQYLLQKP